MASEAARVKRTAYQKEYNRTHRDLRNAYCRDWCKRNPERRFLRYLRHRLKTRYGLTVTQYQDLIKRQNGLCAICTRPFEIPTETNRVRNGRSVVVDHKGKAVRGLLCNNCNRAIGLFEDNISSLKSAIIYLEKQGEPCTHDI